MQYILLYIIPVRIMGSWADPSLCCDDLVSLIEEALNWQTRINKRILILVLKINFIHSLHLEISSTLKKVKMNKNWLSLYSNMYSYKVQFNTSHIKEKLWIYVCIMTNASASFQRYNLEHKLNIWLYIYKYAHLRTKIFYCYGYRLDQDTHAMYDCSSSMYNVQ